MQKTSQQHSDELNQVPQPIRGDLGASILGPHNVPVERENPDLLASPSTDNGTIPNLKFSFANARNRLSLFRLLIIPYRIRTRPLASC
jgi:oxalate decarboxylase